MKRDWLTTQLEQFGLNRKEAPTDMAWQEFLDRLASEIDRLSDAGPGKDQRMNQIRDLDEAEDQQRSATSDARYRAIVEDQTEFINRYAPDGTITFVNESYARLHNTRPEKMIGKSHRDFMTAENADHLDQIRSGLTPESPIVTTENKLVKPDGEILWLQWRDRVICDENGKVIEFQGVGRDITERKQAEEALRESEEKFRNLAEKSPNMIFRVERSFTSIKPVRKSWATHARSTARQISSFWI
jgi:PAS domain S-box-containing protein